MTLATKGRTSAPGAGADVLERRYRRALVAYPRDYRRGYGDELITTLLETEEPGRTLPSSREVAALIREGLRTRVTHAARGSAGSDGVHLGVVVLAVTNLAMLVPYAGTMWPWVGVSAVTVLAATRGMVWAAIPLVVLTATKVCGITLGYPWLDQTLLPIFADPLWDAPALYSQGGPVTPVAAYALEFLGLAVLALRGRPLSRRSWGWWAVVPLLAGADPAGLDIAAGSAHAVSRIALELALLVLAVWAGHVAGDARWAIAAGVHLLASSVVLAENIETFTRQDLTHWALLAVLTAAAAVVPYRTRRHAAL